MEGWVTPSIVSSQTWPWSRSAPLGPARPRSAPLGRARPHSAALGPTRPRSDWLGLTRPQPRPVMRNGPHPSRLHQLPTLEGVTLARTIVRIQGAPRFFFFSFRCRNRPIGCSFRFRQNDGVFVVCFCLRKFDVCLFSVLLFLFLVGKHCGCVRWDRRQMSQK